MNSENLSFWSLPADRVLQQLHSSAQGLSDRDAQQRLVKYGANSLKQQRKSSAFGLLLNQFKSPIVLILMFAAALSIFLKDRTDAIIILAIVLISGLLGFWQERGATDAVEKLTPQLLPAIVSVNLARGAKQMAKKQVIVKRLAAILQRRGYANENFGSMNVFCTDKTGTLTEGDVKIHAAIDADGKDSVGVGGAS